MTHDLMVSEIIKEIEHRLTYPKQYKELNQEHARESLDTLKKTSTNLYDVPCYENSNFKSIFAFQILLTPKEEWGNLLTYYFYRQPINFSETYFKQIEDPVLRILEIVSNKKFAKEFKKEYKSWKKYFNYLHKLQNHFFDNTLKLDNSIKLTKAQAFACTSKNIAKVREGLQGYFEDYQLSKLDDFLNFFRTDEIIIIKENCVSKFLEQVSFHIKVKELMPDIDPTMAKKLIMLLFRAGGANRTYQLINSSSFKKYYDPTIAQMEKKSNNKLNKTHIVDRRSDPMRR